MRRRSDRKKSTDVQPTPPPSRRSTRRSRKSSEDKYESRAEVIEKEEEEQKAPENVEERRKSRSTRNCTPVKEPSMHPVKEAISRFDGDEAKVDTIPEEDNDVDESGTDQKESVSVPQKSTLPEGHVEKEEETNTNADRSVSASLKENQTQSDSEDKNEEKESFDKDVNMKNVPEDAIEDNGHNDESEGEKAQEQMEHQENEQVPNQDSPKKSVHGDLDEKAPVAMELPNHKSVTVVNEESISEDQNNDDDLSPQKTHEVNSVSIGNEVVRDLENETNIEITTTMKTPLNVESGRRKRKWLTKKTNDAKVPPVLSISTDSLKELISDVQPVPLSDVRLESSSEVEEVESEREEGEESATDDDSNQLIMNNSKSDGKLTTTSLNTASKRKVELTTNTSAEQNVTAATAGAALSMMPIPHAPSPARNQSSNILYITNLVRPFTVLQLKGLLARTGNIVEDGFWIDRIKSKCYVEYETEDQAIETRHALHGIRWPVSNPKCLNVEFSIKANMDEAIRSTKDEAPKLSQDNNRENFIVGGGWTRDNPEINDKKGNRPVREWDVGKKDSSERDKSREADRRYSKERNSSSHNDADRKDRDRRDRRNAKGRDPRSSSLSPARKLKKKENEPPLRLLDDLFRKTKATPCIYWLPLTPEQIAEKEAFRQKRIEEHKERIKQRELEMRNKDNEKERNRRERDREQRRRSRSRDRRRY